MIDIYPYIDRLELQKEYMNKFIDSIRFGRRVGNTTRLADFMIQFLFDNGEVVVKDHHRPNGSLFDQEHLFGIILRRLDFEHQMNPTNGRIKINRKTLTIKTKPQ